MTKRYDLTGQTFGELTVLKDIGSRNNQGWSLVRCSCGVVKEIRNVHMTSGRTVSCGCRNPRYGKKQKQKIREKSLAYTLQNAPRTSPD